SALLPDAGRCAVNLLAPVHTSPFPIPHSLLSTPMPTPTAITLHRASRLLEVAFDTGEVFRLPAEYLRVHSPSAEVQGHGPGQRVLVAGKREVGIVAVEPVGQYAVLLRFDDGHATGIYS